MRKYILFMFFIIPVYMTYSQLPLIKTQPYVKEYEKNGCKVILKVQDTILPYFGGTNIRLTVIVADGCLYYGTDIDRSSMYTLSYDEKKMNERIKGPSKLEFDLKIYPFRYGDINLMEFIMHFNRQKGDFTIETAKIPITVYSLLDQDSKLLNISMPEFKEYSFFKNIRIALVIVFAIGTILIITVIIRKNRKEKQKNAFWENWGRMHMYKEDRKLFYNMLTENIKEYVSNLSGENFRSRPLVNSVDWIFGKIGKYGQLQHDLSKAAKEWERVKFKKNHVTELYWRDDLNLVKRIFLKIENILDRNNNDR